MKLLYLLFFLLLIWQSPMTAQNFSNQDIANLIEKYRKEDRGPYRDIRWFCKDGTTNEPKVPCEEKGGKQRARYKDELIALAKAEHIFLAQILATTDEQDFWDEDNYNSRIKQYLLEQYLKEIDNGWINETAQFYRGAYQIEDERAWGRDFLTNRLQYNSNVEKFYFLLRQATQMIPHDEETDLSFRIRAVSKNISEVYPKFQDLRIKIHGQPDANDLPAVKAFLKDHDKKLSAALKSQFATLITDMEEAYQPVNLNLLTPLVKQLSSQSDIRNQLEDYITTYSGNADNINRLIATADLIWNIRLAFPDISKRSRLPLMDISNDLERQYFREISDWQPATNDGMRQQICYTAKAVAGAGFIEIWEWQAAEGQLSGMGKESLADWENYLNATRRLIEWGTGTVSGVFGETIERFQGFERKAGDFTDDRIRSSVLLRLGQQVGGLGDRVAKDAGYANHIFSIKNQGQSRGLNPGYAKGELVVMESSEENQQVDNSKIYLFRRPPADLKPVAGIATVTEGNMVSHVQLLARNLGIPNAVISGENFQDLKAYHGQEVFYAVSNKGTIIMKPASEMNEIEKQLFANKERNQNKVTVPVDKIDLKQQKVLDMREVDASSSGKICGPKAANLGQLKVLFPELVVEGLVIPFGIFREHLDQEMPEADATYWQFLNAAFEEAGEMEKRGESTDAIQEFTLAQLKKLQTAILDINLLPTFVDDLEASYLKVFKAPIGNVPVFLRSDTNMEDLKEFTGAGLNLTKFNVVDRNKILAGIREVWASPYTERSFKWRQSYLLNPENVYPSILIIPSVDVENSGVMITKGITTRDGRDVTVAFSRGAGGAVDGQAAESYLLDHRFNNVLLSPAREPNYRRLPKTGGSVMNKTTFNEPILKDKNLQTLRELAFEIHRRFPHDGTGGPWDIELGFLDDQAWLFQVRPFVENKGALSNAYLESISENVK